MLLLTIWLPLDTELSVDGEKTSPEQKTRPGIAQMYQIRTAIINDLIDHLALHLTAASTYRGYHPARQRIELRRWFQMNHVISFGGLHGTHR